MPQMMPMSWMMMFIFFVTIFMMFNVMNYSMFSITPIKKKEMQLKSMYMSWKW